MPQNSTLPYLVGLSLTLVLASCGGGGSSPSNTSQPVQLAPPPAPTPTPTPPSTQTTLSGTLTFERVPLNAVTNGLDYNSAFEEPIRKAAVDLLDSSGAVIETTTSNDAGFYSFPVASNATVSVRARAQIIQNNANFRVIDNTSGDAVYTLQGSAASVGAGPQTRDLVAESGWTGTAYTQTRAAAPFALLDTVLGSIEDFAAVDSAAIFPELDILWSVNNRSEGGNVAAGQIGTSSYTVSNGRPQIRILGDANADTDEYDVHIVVHEFGHYIENQLSRSDSPGGPHSLAGRLDPRLAFSEGWGNALSAIVTGDPIYRDSGGQSQANGFSFNVESNNVSNPGWYSEASAQSILYDIFDSAADGSDQISLGLGPIFSAFQADSYKRTNYLTTLHSYIDVLSSQATAADQAALTTLMQSQQIFGTGPDGANETNDGGLSSNLPVYHSAVVDASPLTLCSVNDNGLYNRLGNRAFATLALANETTLSFRMERVSGSTGTDPDFDISLNNGLYVVRDNSPTADLETDTLRLSAGNYVIHAFDDGNTRLNETGADSCYSFSVNGG